MNVNVFGCDVVDEVCDGGVFHLSDAVQAESRVRAKLGGQ